MMLGVRLLAIQGPSLLCTGSLMMSRSANRFLRKSSTSPLFLGPPMFSIRIPVFGFFFSEAAAGSELEAAGEVEEQNLPRAVNENSRNVHNIWISLEGPSSRL